VHFVRKSLVEAKSHRGLGTPLSLSVPCLGQQSSCLPEYSLPWCPLCTPLQSHPRAKSSPEKAILLQKKGSSSPHLLRENQSGGQAQQKTANANDAPTSMGCLPKSTARCSLFKLLNILY